MTGTARCQTQIARARSCATEVVGCLSESVGAHDAEPADRGRGRRAQRDLRPVLIVRLRARAAGHRRRPRRRGRLPGRVRHRLGATRRVRSRRGSLRTWLGTLAHRRGRRSRPPRGGAPPPGDQGRGPALCRLPTSRRWRWRSSPPSGSALRWTCFPTSSGAPSSSRTSGARRTARLPRCSASPRDGEVPPALGPSPHRRRARDRNRRQERIEADQHRRHDARRAARCVHGSTRWTPTRPSRSRSTSSGRRTPPTRSRALRKAAAWIGATEALTPPPELHDSVLDAVGSVIGSYRGRHSFLAVYLSVTSCFDAVFDESLTGRWTYAPSNGLTVPSCDPPRVMESTVAEDRPPTVPDVTELDIERRTAIFVDRFVTGRCGTCEVGERRSPDPGAVVRRRASRYERARVRHHRSSRLVARDTGVRDLDTHRRPSPGARAASGAASAVDAASYGRPVGHVDARGPEVAGGPIRARRHGSC